MSAAESLPSEAVRVFVGNLVPTITDVALLRLFSRFGEPSKLERHTQGYAHLSIKPNDNSTNDIDRCISALNRTSWCGTTLRVERAQEHYLARLKREWAEERNQNGDAMEIAADKPCEDHFAKLKKGKHTRFSFPDIEPSKSSLESEKEDQFEETNLTNVIGSAADQNKPDANLSRQETNVKPSAAKSVKLDSTLTLFGLSSTSVDRPEVVERMRENKRQDPPREESPAKRPRSRARNEEHVETVSENPSDIDISSEKEAARMVLQKLFPESQPTPSGSASCRRLGLYRKLMQAPDDQTNRDEDRARKHDQASFHDSEPSRTKEAAERSSALSFRRAGLYRMLNIQVVSK